MKLKKRFQNDGKTLSYAENATSQFTVTGLKPNFSSTILNFTGMNWVNLVLVHYLNE